MNTLLGFRISIVQNAYNDFIKLIKHQVYSADKSTAQTHQVSLTLLNPDQVVLDQTEFRDEGEIKDIQVPTKGLHEICFDGR